jgi:murein DD-endopeptidase MepM/ murein hydrolase activator NlpD
MRAGGYTVMIHKEGALASRQVRFPAWAARAVIIAASLLLLATILAVVFYGPTATAAARAPLLEREVTRLRAENARVAELARRLDEVEARYAQLRGMLGGNVALPGAPGTTVRAPGEDRLYVAPPIEARSPAPADSAEPPGPSAPHRWPLVVASYRTRGLAVGDPRLEAHAGLDLAVPVGSEVRASGGGRISEAGTDSAYGLFVRIAHGEGYESMYGHLSRVVVGRGEDVRAGQIIALSGNTGRSTAPHLHFEIRRGGRSVDPLSLVKEGP